MSTQIKAYRILLAMLIMFSIVWSQAEAQRMNHGSAGRSSARPSAGSQQTINGGSYRSSSRYPSNKFSQNRVSQPSAGMNNSGARAGTSDRKGAGNYSGSGNRANAGNNRDVNINIDRDININNSHNTVVRRNNVAVYHRPPYHYGGRAFYCHHPYHYHPYRPFFWDLPGTPGVLL